MNNGLSIKDLENLSGIKAHTIRMWEKRYSIFDPQRTETNIRYYSSNDLKKLLNITSILDNGMRISQVSSLSEEELNNQILALKQENVDASKRIIVNELIVATLQCDAFHFESKYTEYFDNHGFESTIENILYPLLVRIGLMWTVSKLNPAQEHFASQLIKQKLFSAINNLPLEKSNRKFLLFLPEGEDHEIGLLYSNYLIRNAGYQCIYLGPNVPLNDVAECSRNANPTEILCAFTLKRSVNKMANYLSKIETLLESKKVYLHGISDTSDFNELGENISILKSIDDLKNLL